MNEIEVSGRTKCNEWLDLEKKVAPYLGKYFKSLLLRSICELRFNSLNLDLDMMFSRMTPTNLA